MLIKRLTHYLLCLVLLCVSCSNTVEQKNSVSEFYLINGLGREIVPVVYENIQGVFVVFGVRMQPGDTTLIFKDLVPANTPPSSIITLVRILESDSSTFISAITADNDYQWRCVDDGNGNLFWYYAVR